MKVEEFKVEQGIPAPRPGTGRRGIYPFATMQIGESFDLPNRKRFLRASRAAYMYACRHGIAFTCDVDQRRIWRVK